MRKIMVVDDELAIRDLLAALLEDEGYVVVTAEDGQRALELLPKERPDLVLLDIMMPGMDGREVCRRILELPGVGDTPIIMMSAAVRPTLGDCGIAGFLPKPFDFDQLLVTIRRVLDSRSGSGGVRPTLYRTP